MGTYWRTMQSLAQGGTPEGCASSRINPHGDYTPEGSSATRPYLRFAPDLVFREYRENVLLRFDKTSQVR